MNLSERLQNRECHGVDPQKVQQLKELLIAASIRQIIIPKEKEFPDPVKGATVEFKRPPVGAPKANREQVLAIVRSLSSDFCIYLSTLLARPYIYSVFSKGIGTSFNAQSERVASGQFEYDKLLERVELSLFKGRQTAADMSQVMINPSMPLGRIGELDFDTQRLMLVTYAERFGEVQEVPDIISLKDGVTISQINLE